MSIPAAPLPLTGQFVTATAPIQAAPRLNDRYELFDPRTVDGTTVVVGRRSRHFPEGEASRILIDDPVVCPEHFLAELHHKGLWVTPLEKRENAFDLGADYGTWIQDRDRLWRRATCDTLLRPDRKIALGPMGKTWSQYRRDPSDAVVLKLLLDGRTLRVESPRITSKES